MEAYNFICDDCGYSFMRLTDKLRDNRLKCLRCTGWMHPHETEPYKEPNILWVGFGHVIWFFLKPLSNWLDKHDKEYDDD